MSPRPVDREQERFFEELDHARILADVVKKMHIPGDSMGAKIAHAKRLAKNKRRNQDNQMRRRAAKAEAPLIERVIRTQIIERDKATCWICGKRCQPHEIHLDHVVPLALGGSHTASNVKVACVDCNLRKGAMHPDLLRPMPPSP